MGRLLLRGMIVGLIAGLLSFGFARLFGEPQVQQAIAFEARAAQARGEAPEPVLVSRPTQAGIGLFTGLVVYGAAMGGLFSLVFALVYGRFARLSPRATAALLALGAFAALVLVPALKYPANPPAIGDPETIGIRTKLYFEMLTVSLSDLCLAIALARRLSARIGAWNACLLAAVVFVVSIALIEYALPDLNEVPDQFSAVVLWRFRMASLGMQALLWATIGLLFGSLTDRQTRSPWL